MNVPVRSGAERSGRRSSELQSD